MVAGIDIDADCQFPYEANNPGAKFVQADVSEFSTAELRALYPPESRMLLAGCAPCQPFSMLNHGKDPWARKEWRLLDSFARLVSQLKPEFVSMENVPQVKRRKPFKDFLQTLKTHEYAVDWKVINSADYGVPQERRRLVLLGSRIGSIQVPSPTHLGNKRRTVRQAISELPKVEAGKCDSADPLHAAAGLKEINLRRIRASEPGGTWQDWPEDLKLACHKKKTGRSFTPVYGRMKWDSPSPTITTQAYNLGSGRFGHPSQDRAITLREAAILQTFPRSYQFVPPNRAMSLSTIGKLIGNAVPPRLGEVLARAILGPSRSFEGAPPTTVLPHA